MNENKLKHLEFIQNVITRMNTNSFLIKGWMVTIVAAVFVLAAKEEDPRFLLVVLFAVFVFWLLDGFYLSQERQYRDLYEAVRQKQEPTDFSMDATPYKIGRNTWQRAIFSWTTGLLYGPVILLTLVLKCFMTHQGLAAVK